MNLWRTTLPKNIQQPFDRSKKQNDMQGISEQMSIPTKIYTSKNLKNQQQSPIKRISATKSSSNNYPTQPYNSYPAQPSKHSQQKLSHRVYGEVNNDSIVEEVIDVLNMNTNQIQQHLVNALESSNSSINGDNNNKIIKLNMKVFDLKNFFEEMKSFISKQIKHFQHFLNELRLKLSDITASLKVIKMKSAGVSSNNSSAVIEDQQSRNDDQLQNINKQLLKQLQEVQNLNFKLTESVYDSSLKNIDYQSEKKKLTNMVIGLMEQNKSLICQINKVRSMNTHLEEQMFNLKQQSTQIELRIKNQMLKFLESNPERSISEFSKRVYTEQIKKLTQELQELKVNACTSSRISIEKLEERELTVTKKQKELESSYLEFQNLIMETDLKLEELHEKQLVIRKQMARFNVIKQHLQKREKTVQALEEQAHQQIWSSPFVSTFSEKIGFQNQASNLEGIKEKILQRQIGFHKSTTNHRKISGMSDHQFGVGTHGIGTHSMGTHGRMSLVTNLHTPHQRKSPPNIFKSQSSSVIYSQQFSIKSKLSPKNSYMQNSNKNRNLKHLSTKIEKLKKEIQSQLDEAI